MEKTMIKPVYDQQTTKYLQIVMEIVETW